VDIPRLDCGNDHLSPLDESVDPRKKETGRLYALHVPGIQSGQPRKHHRMSISPQIYRSRRTDLDDQRNETINKEPTSEGKNQDEDSLEKGKPRGVGFAEGTKEEKTSPSLDRYVSPQEAPSYWTLFMNEMVETHPFFCGCLKKKYGLESISQEDGYVDRAREKTTLGKFLIGLKRFLWYLFSAACFFFTIVNIGSTHQQCAAKAALPSTFELLYPPDFLNGTTCAWDTPGPNATIKTFESL
jgi:hypothetical protein